MGNISHLPVPPVINIRHYKYNEKGVYGLYITLPFNFLQRNLIRRLSLLGVNQISINFVVVTFLCVNIFDTV